MRHSFASSLVLSLIIATLRRPTTTKGFQLFTHFITQLLVVQPLVT